jgi:K+-sensing histidine kinase KdpD
VLRKAAELGRELRASVVAVHGIMDIAGGESARLAKTRQKLEHATRSIAGQLEAMVFQAPDPVDGILQQARARDASLIVVGTRLQRPKTESSTAARLVMRARRSILVEPFGMPLPRPLATP